MSRPAFYILPKAKHEKNDNIFFVCKTAGISLFHWFHRWTAFGQWWLISRLMSKDILSAYVKIQKWIQHYLNSDWIYGSISTSNQRDFLKSIAMTFILTLFFIVHHSQKDHGGNESDDDERDQEHPVHHHGNLLPFVPRSSEWSRFVAKVELFRLSDLVYFIGDIQWDVGTLCSFLQVHGWQVEYRCFISILIVGILPNILKQKAVHDDFSCAKYNKSVKDIWTKIF